MKVSHDLERIGDYARNGAKRAIVLASSPRSAASTASSAWRSWCRRT
jgi:phosphate uptake regulator